MVYLGEFYLGGSEGKDDTGDIFYSGIGFLLSSKCECSQLISFDNCRWEAEVKKEHSSVVVRCREIHTIEEILSMGYEYCQRLLDIISLKYNIRLRTKSADSANFIIYRDPSGDFILRISSLDKLNFGLEASATIYDIKGNIQPQPREPEPEPEPEPEWIPAYRYYRLSQTTEDLFEAYRNIFLCFENILNSICPKNTGEREVDWFKRALNQINPNVPLSNYSPPGTLDPIDYFYNSQYRDLRVKLFHAKNQIILPQENPNPSLVLEGYKTLVTLILKLVEKYFNMKNASGGFTFFGFKMLADRMAQSVVEIQVTDDSSPTVPEDTLVSPKGRPVFSLSDSHCFSNYQPGRVLIYGKMEGTDLNKVGWIYRIGTFLDGILYYTDLIQDGIYIKGIEKLEYNQFLQMRNKNYPKLDY